MTQMSSTSPAAMDRPILDVDPCLRDLEGRNDGLSRDTDVARAPQADRVERDARRHKARLPSRAPPGPVPAETGC